MCWACLNADHLDVPASPAAMTKIAESVVSTSRALLARVEDPAASWSYPLPDHQGPVIISYSFFEASEVPDANNGPTQVSSFWAFSEAQRANFRLALAEYSKVAGIVFVETEGRAMMQAYGASGSDYGGWGFFPASQSYSSNACDLVIDSTGTFGRGSYGFYTALHEIGHVMGLKHPFAGSVTLTDALDTTAHTVMSYTNGGTPTELKSLDISALQTLYGHAVNTTGWKIRFSGETLHVAGSGRTDNITGVGLTENRMAGLGGSDTLIGREENDTMFGGDGADYLIGLDGADVMHGGAGRDTLFGGTTSLSGTEDSDDSLYGGDGADSLVGTYISDLLVGGAGDDVIEGRGYTETLRGGAGDDVMRYSGQHASIWGGTGADDIHGSRLEVGGFEYAENLHGGAGYDTIFGDAGSDLLYADADGGLLYGGKGNDSLFGGPTGTARLFGDSGDDVIIAGRGLAVIDGGAGNDTLRGGSIFGNAGKGATLKGGNGDDVLYGVSPGDILDGSAGNDILLGRHGNDLRGGSGFDVFLFDAAMTGLATIEDFVAAEDRIILQGLSGTSDFQDLSFRTDPSGVIVSITPSAGGSYLEILLKGLDLAEVTPDMFTGQDGAWLV